MLLIPRFALYPFGYQHPHSVGFRVHDAADRLSGRSRNLFTHSGDWHIVVDYAHRPANGRPVDDLPRHRSSHSR